MKIAYVTSYDAKDIGSWSGTGNFIWKSLEDRGHQIEFVGPLKVPAMVRQALNFKCRLYRQVLGRMYLPDHDLMTAKAFSREAGHILSRLDTVDAVISPGTIPVAYLRGKLPLIIYTDCTHRLLFGTYPTYKGLGSSGHRQGDIIEKKAHCRAAALIFASKWAAESAIRDYGTDPAKIHEVPFGANLKFSQTRSFVETAIEARDRKTLRLLFIGVEWERKGGPAAIEVQSHLIKMGIPTELTIIGCKPEINNNDGQKINILGYIKKDAAGQQLIHEELAKSHFLILLSRAECFGVAYCEASSFGVPSIARNVGGVASAVRNGRNGWLFNSEDSALAIAEWLARRFRHYESYRELALSSFVEYESELNWRVAGEKIEAILKSVV